MKPTLFSILGVFFCSAAILSLEVMCSVGMSVIAFSNLVFFSISFVTLGVGGGYVLVAKLQPKLDELKAIQLAGLSSLVGAAFTIFFHLGLRFFCDAYSSLMNHVLNYFPRYLSSAVFGAQFLTIPILGFLLLPSILTLSVPLALLLSTSSIVPKKWCGVDLMGAAVGAIGTIALFYRQDYFYSLVFSIFLSLAAAICFSVALKQKKKSQIVGISGCLVLLIWIIYSGATPIEPRPHLFSLARVVNSKKFKVSEIWHGWNQFGRLSQLSLVDTENETRVERMALGQGGGHISLTPFKITDVPLTREHPIHFARLAVIPKEALILCAGAGHDMIEFDAISEGNSIITGVEMNPAIMNRAVKINELSLNKFLEKKNIRYFVSEARTFLENSTHRYDSIYIPNWGGGKQRFLGWEESSNSMFLTVEGIQTILNRLTPQGHFTVVQGNKVKLLPGVLKNLRAIGSAPEHSIMIFGNETVSINPFSNDDQILIVKPMGFTEHDREYLAHLYRQLNLDILYPSSDQLGTSGVFKKMIEEHISPSDIAKLYPEYTLLDLESPTDDKPFFSNLLTLRYYLVGWKNYLQLQLRRVFFPNTPQDDYPLSWYPATERDTRLPHAVITLFLVLVSGFSILRLIRSDLIAPVSKHDSQRKLLFFLALSSFGFYSLEIFLVQKLQFYFGSMAVSISLGVSAILFFSGLGSFQNKLNANPKNIALYTFISLLMTVTTILLFERNLLGLAVKEKAVISCILIALPSFFAGQLFPTILQIVKTKQPSGVPVAFAVSTLVGALPPILSLHIQRLFGVFSIVLLALLCYLLIIILSSYFESRTEAP
jgi:hypothetical protein